MPAYLGIIVANSTNDVPDKVGNVRYSAQTITAPGIPSITRSDEIPIAGREWDPTDDVSANALEVIPAQIGDACVILAGPHKVGIHVLSEIPSAGQCGAAP